MIYYLVIDFTEGEKMKFRKKEIFTLPNVLTYIRIACVPFFIWIILDARIANNILIAFGIFIFATCTDMVDGFIARHYNLISDIGKVADPIADKLLQVSTLICLTLLDKIPLVFPIVFVIKETYMVLGGSVIVKIFKSEYVLQSNIFGKAATCLNSLGIVLAFFAQEGNRAYDVAVNTILVCGAVFAVVTAGIYTYQFFVFRKKELADKAAAQNASYDDAAAEQTDMVEIAEGSNADSAEISVTEVEGSVEAMNAASAEKQMSVAEGSDTDSAEAEQNANADNVVREAREVEQEQ